MNSTEPATNQSNSRLIAFYLPQFHPIPENDVWWGKGFTEWHNVVQGRPLFPEHYQPHLPADLGYYDLRLPEVREAQAQLASRYGIAGFCYYHYWFNGRRLLERPFDEVLKSGTPDFPFCLCWVNETWSRNWDSGAQDPLIKQEYGGEDDDRAHIQWLIHAFQDKRYMTVNGRPLLGIYRVDMLPAVEDTFTIWRDECTLAGVPMPYLVGFETGSAPLELTRRGCDAAAEFFPHRVPGLISPIKNDEEYTQRHSIYHYEDLVQAHLSNPLPKTYTRFPCVTPNWDNTSRRPNKSAFLLHGSTPELYEHWLKGTIEKQADNAPEENIIFINAWNEWAEGAHLEPDIRYGQRYLEATLRAQGASATTHLQRGSGYRGASPIASLPTQSDLYSNLYEKYTYLQKQLAVLQGPNYLINALQVEQLLTKLAERDQQQARAGRKWPVQIRRLLRLPYRIAKKMWRRLRSLDSGQ